MPWSMLPAFLFSTHTASSLAFYLTVASLAVSSLKAVARETVSSLLHSLHSTLPGTKQMLKSYSHRL